MVTHITCERCSIWLYKLVDRSGKNQPRCSYVKRTRPGASVEWIRRPAPHQHNRIGIGSYLSIIIWTYLSLFISLSSNFHRLEWLVQLIPHNNDGDHYSCYGDRSPYTLMGHPHLLLLMTIRPWRYTYVNMSVHTVVTTAIVWGMRMARTHVFVWEIWIFVLDDQYYYIRVSANKFVVRSGQKQQRCRYVKRSRMRMARKGEAIAWIRTPATL